MNIWVAAGDGDLTAVSVPISPNAPDPFTYTPMHAAASYGHLHVLDFLLSHGGDVNVTDDDGDTPLYTVENVETARWLVQHGAIVDRTNTEGLSPIDHLHDDFPQVAAYLRSLSPHPPSPPHPTHHQLPSQHHQNIASEVLTTSLMQSVQHIIQRADAEARNPDDDLRQAVSRTVFEGVLAGYEMTTPQQDARDDPDQTDGPNAVNGVKRPKTDG
ncbi:hypothetical protein SERLA73DRAFT_89676 [Serpula lacrymans var. lacrymans S7.3]|uniref:Uncharacterized protein n=2 Tax=Serpula lacrymans var. lacrymans TaxID=341189 RepID=F8PXU0_SERL3|nr:uncharacterized protein SERLADRAFT_356019 [Serpula lacrymans var. lacrymans S7.9]EGN98703.1 hypothetical protein SERLA73DRAFT_89676 [Serpula lacrymans var. lacrymans S7.3]EGO24307.1 hypothetical protein SERLADRAFT_356019 [Serpula lacrymans var. lacrymans S7.9]